MASQIRRGRGRPSGSGYTMDAPILDRIADAILQDPHVSRRSVIIAAGKVSDPDIRRLSRNFQKDQVRLLEAANIRSESEKLAIAKKKQRSAPEVKIPSEKSHNYIDYFNEYGGARRNMYEALQPTPTLFAAVALGSTQFNSIKKSIVESMTAYNKDLSVITKALENMSINASPMSDFFRNMSSLTTSVSLSSQLVPSSTFGASIRRK